MHWPMQEQHWEALHKLTNIVGRLVVSVGQGSGVSVEGPIEVKDARTFNYVYKLKTDNKERFIFIKEMLLHFHQKLVDYIAKVEGELEAMYSGFRGESDQWKQREYAQDLDYRFKEYERMFANIEIPDGNNDEDVSDIINKNLQFPMYFWIRDIDVKHLANFNTVDEIDFRRRMTQGLQELSQRFPSSSQ